MGHRHPVTPTCQTRYYFAKEPLIIGLFCGKLPIKIKCPMTLRHPVQGGEDS